MACLEVPAQKSRRAVPAAFALPLQQGRAREGAQGRRRRAAGAGRCPPTPLPRFLLGSSCGPELEERQGRAVRQMGTAPPPPSRGGCRWRSWCCLAAGGRGGAGGSQGSSGAVGRAAAVPREKVTGGRAMDRRVPEKAPRRAVVPGRGPAGSASEARGGGVGGAAPCRNRRRGLPGAGAAGRWERGAAASSKGKELPRSCCLPCCRLPRPSSLLSAGQKAGDGRDPFSPPFGGGTRFASRYPHLLVSAQPARKDQAAARFAPTGWGGEEKREEKARGSRRGRGGSLTSYGGRQKRD